MNRLEAEKQPIGTLFIQPGGYTTIWVNTHKGLFVFESGTGGSAEARTGYNIVTIEELVDTPENIINSDYNTAHTLSILNYQTAKAIKKAFGKYDDELYAKVLMNLLTM